MESIAPDLIGGRVASVVALHENEPLGHDRRGDWRVVARRRHLPVEAAVVWLAAPFSCILNGEFANAFFHHTGATREAVFGSRR